MSAFNQNPIIVTAPMPQSYWTTLRLAGLLPAGMGKPIIIQSITWQNPGVNASFFITDAFGNELFAGSTNGSFSGADPVYTFPRGKRVRDFQVTILSAGNLIIDYV